MSPLETLRARLVSLKASHDTAFEYADDHSVWLKGAAELRVIRSIEREILAMEPDCMAGFDA